MAEKETKNERRLREEKELDKLNLFGIESKYPPRGAVGKLVDRALGRDDGYGTSRSAGAQRAGADVAEEQYNKEGATIGETMTSPRARKAMREAAAEERREARGYAKGGSVRGDGCAQRGKTKGRFV